MKYRGQNLSVPPKTTTHLEYRVVNTTYRGQKISKKIPVAIVSPVTSPSKEQERETDLFDKCFQEISTSNISLTLYFLYNKSILGSPYGVFMGENGKLYLHRGIYIGSDKPIVCKIKFKSLVADTITYSGVCLPIGSL